MFMLKSDREIRIAILKSDSERNYHLWISAIRETITNSKIELFSFLSDQDFKRLLSGEFDLILATPCGTSQRNKRIYDEKWWALSQSKQTLTYPSVKEIFLYENKRNLRDWLLVCKVPHPETFVFFEKDEAMAFAQSNVQFPIVGKTNIGASGNGVVVLRNRNQLNEYVLSAFGEGVKYKSGPKWLKGSIWKKLFKVLKDPNFFKKRMAEYRLAKAETQRDMMILQEFVEHEFEWRCVRIGESYFAHKKLAINNMSSGTLLKGYGSVPFELLDFIRNLTEENQLSSVSIDIFESPKGYLVNEIQTFFGQSDPYQMLIDGIQGRYIYRDNRWQFEEGEFNQWECYQLRLSHALELWKRGR
jgi:glutathione synthase/RimK-type ligase-like ATP-grasp enzyme